MSKAKSKQTVSTDDIEWPSMDGQKPHRSALPNVLFWLKARGIVAHFNEFNQRACITIDGTEAEFTDREMLRVVSEMHEAGCIVSEGAVVSGVKHLAFKNAFHPVRDYLDGLEWDGTKRLDTLLSRYLGAEATPVNRAIGKAWVVAAVRRVRKPGVKFDNILVLQGEQGAGKSTFFRLLATDAWFNDNLDIGASSKEVIEELSGAWIVEHAELSAMANRDVERVKQFASTQVDRARTAFERTTKSVPRQFVCGASVNQGKFLRDDTGSRRFWIAEVKKLDEAALIEDRDQLWAEAAHLEAKGEAINIPPELWAEVAELNESFAVDDPIADRAHSLLVTLPSNAVVTAFDLACAVGISDVSRQGGKVAQSIAAGAKRAGWTGSRRAVPGVLKTGQRHYRNVDPSGTPRLFVYSDNDTRKPLRPGIVEKPL